MGSPEPPGAKKVTNRYIRHYLNNRKRIVKEPRMTFHHRYGSF
jgi:hypothetical protein